MNFMCVLSRVNTVTFNDVTVDIDLSVYGKSSAEVMVGKRQQMSTPQKQVVISLFVDGDIIHFVRYFRQSLSSVRFHTT
jgi:hypothetical protein